jgi:acyl-CoA synthetase (AMP-forming)/AMP-acid ligase II
VLAKILADGVARHPDDPAVIVGDQTHTYADLFRLSHALARSLSDRGIEAGDRIAFLLPNGLEIVLCYYACFILGAIAVPLNVRFPPQLIAYVLDHSEARVLISEPGLFAGIAPIRSERRHLDTVYLADGMQSGESRTSAICCAPVRPPKSTGVRVRISRLRCSTRRARPAPRRASFTRMAA